MAHQGEDDHDSCPHEGDPKPHITTRMRDASDEVAPALSASPRLGFHYASERVMLYRHCYDLPKIVYNPRGRHWNHYYVAELTIMSIFFPAPDLRLSSKV